MPEIPARSKYKSFAVALMQAIHDFDHEQSADTGAGDDCDEQAKRGSLVHFWDTDCLYGPAFGFRGNPRDGRSDLDHLVQALFSAGFLGKVSMVSPHSNEFARLLERYVQARSEETSSQRILLREYVNEHGLESLMSSLAYAANEGLDSDEALREAISQLALLDRATFPLVEALGGTWDGRVRRLVGEGGLIQRSSSLMPELSEILDHSLFDPLSEALRDERSRSKAGNRRDNMELGVATDAAALCTVLILGKQGSIFPRFYTSSPTILRVLKNHDWAARAFEYEFETGERRVTDTVFRNSEYYFLRATMPALHRPDAPRSPVPEGPTLSELRDLSHSLNEALESNSWHTEKLVNNWKFPRGGTAASILRELEGSAMGLVWLRYNIEPVVREAINGVKAVYDISQTRGSRAIAAELLETAGNHFRGNISDIALQSSLTRDVGRRGQKIVCNSSNELDLESDLAGAIWGVGAGRRVDLSSQDLILFSDIQSLRENPSSADRALSILMGLESFDLVVRLVSALSEGDSRVSEAAWIMGEVARFRSDRSPIEVQTAYGVVCSAWDQLSSDERPAYCLAYAEAAFRLWERGGFADFGIGHGASRRVVDRFPGDPFEIGRWGVSRILENYQAVAGPQRRFALDLVYRFVSSLGLPIDFSVREKIDEVEYDIDGNGYRRWALIAHCQYLKALRDYSADGVGSYSGWIERHAQPMINARNLIEKASRAAPYDSDVMLYRNSIEKFYSEYFEQLN